jgi:predicted dehydrogenase
MLRIGVLGVGYLGKIHMQLLHELPELYSSISFFDPDMKAAKQASEQFGIEPCHSIEALIDSVDVVDVVSTTTSHYQCAANAIRNFKHVFIEKPITTTIEESSALIKLAKEAQIFGQVGHIERFNPAFLAVKEHLNQTNYIEGHRLNTYHGRNTDISVVTDLMIHDIDLILSLSKANVRRISANGSRVVSNNIDIANARIELDNGCVANLTASRIAYKGVRKMRFYQKDQCLVSDFLHKEAYSLSLEKEQIEKRNLPITAINALKDELETFGTCILKQTEPPVSLEDGHRALAVAELISEKIKQGVWGNQEDELFS